uniref:Uncharacterized protein n=1 Tax=Peronospora matthiolae TaxID=2874970 RepID=A0AAV1TVC5_9STRA
MGRRSSDRVIYTLKSSTMDEDTTEKKWAIEQTSHNSTENRRASSFATTFKDKTRMAKMPRGYRHNRGVLCCWTTSMTQCGKITRGFSRDKFFG